VSTKEDTVDSLQLSGANKVRSVSCLNDVRDVKQVKVTLPSPLQ